MTDTYGKVRNILFIILIANLGVAAMKILLGMMIDSASMTADGFHSLTDGSSNVIGLIGIKIASKPVDEDHPYGHRKYEVLAGMFIAAMLFFLGGKILLEAVGRIRNPVVPSVNLWSLGVLLATLVINIFVTVTEYNAGKKLGSAVLMSDAMHTRSDIYVTIGVLITLIGIKLGLPAVIDSIASIVVAGFILFAGYEIFKTTSDVLVDHVVLDCKAVAEAAMTFPEVRDVHKIRSRGTEQDCHLDMHVMVDPATSLEDSHALMHRIEARMREKFAGISSVIVHIEPYDDRNGRKKA